jgi:hypothetical protein
MMKYMSKRSWIAIAIMLAGAILRLFHLFVVPMDEPFRLGGLFYEFSRQIALNNFAFPETIPYYSAGGIPFAYPPLSFYVQAAIIKFIAPPLFYSINLIPPIITLLSLPAFYWMIRQFTDDVHLMVASLLAFALMPTAFINQIEGAGLAESFGIVALILYLGILFRWRKASNTKDSVLGGIALAICVLSSPGSAYAAALFSMVLFVWVVLEARKTRNMKPTGLLLLVGLIGLVISAPYWITVMRNHGFDFFITPFLGQHQSDVSPLQIEQILSFQPGGALLGFIWNWLIFAGLIWAVLKRRYLIVVMFLTFWLIPREGVWLVAIPAAILAGMGFVYILLPLFQEVFQTSADSRPPSAPGILAVVLVILIFANALFSLGAYIAEPEWKISRNQIASLKEFQQGIPENERVIVFGSIGLAEWAPAILQREVLNIEYGLEWQPDELEKVKAINIAIKEKDFAAMLQAIDNYIGEQQFFIIAAPDDWREIQNLIPENVTLIPASLTPELELYRIKIE